MSLKFLRGVLFILRGVGIASLGSPCWNTTLLEDVVEGGVMLLGVLAGVKISELLSSSDEPRRWVEANRAVLLCLDCLGVESDVRLLGEAGGDGGIVPSWIALLSGVLTLPLFAELNGLFVVRRERRVPPTS